jgi:hypothetical protein
MVFCWGYSPYDGLAVHRCPQCDDTGLMQGIHFADHRDIDTWYCFACGLRHHVQDLTPCAGCSRPWPVEADIDGAAAALCAQCRDQLEPEHIA